ncbi:hypothetical protein D3C76_1658100 [compost metagenome]
MNRNSSGSVTPVRNAVSATDSNIPPTIGRRSFGAAKYMASAAPGKPNIMIGKKPDMNIPAVPSPA